MHRRYFLGSLPLLALARSVLATQTRTPIEVIVLPVLHKLHQGNVFYGYDDIYRIVRDFHPDLVGVEIRQEDLPADDDYLTRNYPKEMVHLARLYGSHAFGFDWLGDDVAGNPVPYDWWSVRSPVKRLERSIETAPPPETERNKRLNDELEKFQKMQDVIISKATPATLANGEYDRITRRYYECLRMIYQRTPYIKISDFYSDRDRHLVANIVRRLDSTAARRIAIVTGADHHGPIVNALRTMTNVEIMNIE